MRKSWADQQGIRTGVFGEVIDGVEICEKNRATVWEQHRQGIEELREFMQKNYRSKRVPAVLFGVWHGGVIKYAVFVVDGFLKEVEPE